MSKDKAGHTGVSVKFPDTARNGMLSIDEFNQLFELSGDKNRSVFIHNAVRHYAEVIRQRLQDEQTDIADRADKLNKLFPGKS